MSSERFDLVVIGSGPAGEGASMSAAKSGARVAMVGRRAIGGGCTHSATIPSKALRHQVDALMAVRGNPLLRSHARVNVTFPDLLRATEHVVAQQVALRSEFYHRNHVEIIEGAARFLDKNALEIAGPAGPRVITADKFLLAVGSRPYRPDNIDFTHPRVRDSDTILTLDYTPDSITIYGAGVVGCEYASIFRNLGVKVTLINSRDKLLSFLDEEIIDALSYFLRNQGVLIRHQEEYESVIPERDGVVLNLKSGKRIKSDLLFWAQGRTGNTQELGLENIGVEADSRGQVKVDDSLQVVGSPHVYAAGDVIGYPSLASASYDQGRFAAMHAYLGDSDFELIEQIPTGIYTSPEISSLGKTERELTAERVPYEVGHSLFRSLARAQITGNTTGMLKLLFHRETLEILGIHCFGDEAAEIVHIGQAIMSQPGERNTIRYFINTTFNYPTMAEAYRVAALNGINRLA